MFCFLKVCSFVFCFCVLLTSESILKPRCHLLGLLVSGPEHVLELLRAARARQDKIQRKSESLPRLVELYLPFMRMLDHGTPLASTVFVSGRPEIKLVPAATACFTAILGHVCFLAQHLMILLYHTHLLRFSELDLVTPHRSYVTSMRGSVGDLVALIAFKCVLVVNPRAILHS